MKIIIDNRSELSDYDALMYVRAVVHGGRLPENDNQYAYSTTFTSGVSVTAAAGKDSDLFLITGGVNENH